MSRDCTDWVRRVFVPSIEASPWRPLADVYRTPCGWLVKCEIAGVRPEDLTLTVRGSLLTIGGTRRDWCLEEGCSHYRLEIAYSHFERVLKLPCDLDRAEISTCYRDGLLHVTIRTEEGGQR